MKWPAIILAGFAVSASAEKGSDQPHRDWGQVATLDMEVGAATACIARTMDREGSVLMLPVQGGSDLDYSAGTFLGGSVSKPWATFHVRDKPATTLRITYRHPVNQKWIRRVMRNLTKSCLTVRRIDAI